MKLLYTYFWKTLPIGDLILLAPISLTFSKSSQISQPPLNHLKTLCVCNTVMGKLAENFFKGTSHGWHEHCTWQSSNDKTAGSLSGDSSALTGRQLPGQVSKSSASEVAVRKTWKLDS